MKLKIVKFSTRKKCLTILNTSYMRPTYAEINLSNLKSNLLQIRNIAKGKKILAVVKADAYGHGMSECVAALNSLGNQKPDYYGVSSIDEAMILRQICKIDTPILDFSMLNFSTVNYYVEYKVIPTVSVDDDIRILQSLGGKEIRVQANIDTGMGRIGVKHYNAVNFLKKITEIPGVTLDGVYTHYATADEEDKSFSNIQLDRFKNVLNELKTAGINYGVVHANNSSAILEISDSIFDMIRPGIILYGVSPSERTDGKMPLKQVMSLKSKVSGIKNILKGESVSYGRMYVAKQETNIAIVPIGYADGYDRELSNKIYGIINGKKYRQVGRITMDTVMFDIGFDDIKAGDDIVLLGEQGSQKVTVWDWTRIMKTIPYEVMCGISKRVKRIYKN